MKYTIAKILWDLTERLRGVSINLMNLKSLLARLGLGSLAGAKPQRVSPIARERERFEADAKVQFQKLKDKGISIPVFTL